MFSRKNKDRAISFSSQIGIKMPSNGKIPSTEELDIYVKVVDALDKDHCVPLDAVAKSMNKSIKSIYHLLDRLDDLYGVTLIRRMQRKRSKEVTPEGRAFYLRAKRLLADLISSIPLSRVTVTLGTTNAILNNALGNGIAEFLRGEWRSRASVVLREEDFRDLISGVQTGRLDLAIGPVPPVDYQHGITVKPFGRPVRITLICRKPHPLAVEERKTISLSDLGGELFIALAPGIADPLRQHIPANCEVIEVSHYVTVCNLVRAGVGLGLVPDWRTHSDHEEASPLHFISVSDQVPPIALAAYLPPDIDDPQNLQPCAAALYLALEKNFPAL
jgi:DNA-binding transcriptional LysR family regulator